MGHDGRATVMDDLSLHGILLGADRERCKDQYNGEQSNSTHIF